MNDFIVICPVVNRLDLLEAAIESTAPYDLTIIDNSDGLLDCSKLPARTTVVTPHVPLTFTQTSNLEYRLALSAGARYYVHLHSDAQFPSSRIADILDGALNADIQGRKWLVGFTLYDILCVYKTSAMDDLGGYDAHLFDFYFADNDLWWRAKLAGYERLEFGGEGIVHNGGGSATINGDRRWGASNDNTFPLFDQLYRKKWGGPADKETFAIPFNRHDAFPDTRPLAP